MEYCHFRCTLQLPKKTAHIWRATTGFPKKQLVRAWDRLWNHETWQVWNQWWRRKTFSGHILKLDPFKNMQFWHIDHLFSHSLCAIIPSLVSKAALKEAFYNNNGEANTHSAEISTLNDVSFFCFSSPAALFVHQGGYSVPCDCFNFVFSHLGGCCLMESTCTILVKMFRTLCV